MNATWPKFWISLAVFSLTGLLGFLAVATQIDPAGDLPNWPQGPGLTVDEGFNAEEGVRLVAGIEAWFTGQVTLKEVFGGRDELGPNPPLGYHLADHPPLGRIWLGIWHNIGLRFFESDDAPPRLRIAYARLGSAAAFGLLIALVGVFTTRWYGMPAGVTAAVSLILMPRVFGHAHLAALETVMNLAFFAAILSVAVWWKPVPNPPSPPDAGAVIFAGILWGLALLTKIQAVLIAPPVVVWTIWYWRKKAILPLAIWGGVGLAVFCAGWPWLWWDPAEHLRSYFGSTTNRAALSTWYLGEKFADTAVPWHYPFVMFAFTIPIGLLIFGGLGLYLKDSEKQTLLSDGRLQLVLLAAAFPLCLFAIPGIAVYDGSRLFLVSFPLWAVLAGRGAASLAALSARWINEKFAVAAMVVVLGLQGIGLYQMSPCYLSYYNGLAGGLSGAEQKGMEINYWGDGLTCRFWESVADTVPAGSTVHFTPVLHPLHLVYLQSQIGALGENEITLAICEPTRLDEVTYLIQFERQADLTPEILQKLAGTNPVQSVERQGVVLAGLYRLK